MCRLPLGIFGARFWLVDLSVAPAPEALAVLSGPERERAARFIFDEHRRRYQAAHAGLRAILAAELSLSAAGIDFRFGAHDKPSLPEEYGCMFNMSHSDELALIALATDLPAGWELGIDIEKRHPVTNAMELAAANFTAAEQHELAREPAATRDELFLTGWTRKEACLKAVGSGLSIAPTCFECGLAPVRALTWIPTKTGRMTVEVESIDVGHGHLAAIAITVPAADY
jgi:4'-phosphopantetheinyl transferase